MEIYPSNDAILATCVHSFSPTRGRLLLTPWTPCPCLRSPICNPPIGIIIDNAARPLHLCRLDASVHRHLVI